MKFEQILLTEHASCFMEAGKNLVKLVKVIERLIGDAQYSWVAQKFLKSYGISSVGKSVPDGLDGFILFVLMECQERESGRHSMRGGF